MKQFFTLAIGVLFLTLGKAQSGNEPQVQSPQPATSTGVRSFSEKNIYYKDNMISYFKERTGEDLLLTYPSFPRFVDTGDKDKDIVKYQSNVYEWMRNHPDFTTKYKINVADLNKTN